MSDERMTLQELGRRLKREHPGDYDDVPNEDLASAFLEKRPDLQDLVTVAPIPAPPSIPANVQKILDAQSSTIFDIFRTFGARKQAEVLAFRNNSVASYFGMLQNAEAGALGVSSAVLEQMKLKTHETNEAIRLALAQAMIAMKQKELEETTRQRQNRNDAEMKLEFAVKLAEIEQVLNELRKQVRRPHVQKADEPEMGGLDPDSIP